MADFDVGIWPLARLDAIEPILDVRPGDPAVAFPLISHCRIGRILHKIDRVGGELVAVDFHFAIGADEDGPAHWAALWWAFALEPDRSAVGVSHRDDSFWSIRPELRRAGVIFAE